MPILNVPPSMKNTRWRNPTQHRLIADLHTEATASNPTGLMRVVWEPGETVEVSSDFDTAIQKVRGGKVVGGLVPQLVRDGGKPIPLDPAIDAEAAEKKIARDRVVAAAAIRSQGEAMLAEAAIAAQKAPPAEEPEKVPERPQPPQQGQGQGRRDDRDRR
jgi:hypothetical protein